MFRRISRAIARFNKWLGPAAVAGSGLQSGTPQQANAAAVRAILGEIDESSAGRDGNDEKARGELDPPA